ncbi:MAG: hypothetical protein DRP00_04415, partial [Candidatus Aenigmatarchaeota archaeon]
MNEQLTTNPIEQLKAEFLPSKKEEEKKQQKQIDPLDELKREFLPRIWAKEKIEKTPLKVKEAGFLETYVKPTLWDFLHPTSRLLSVLPFPKSEEKFTQVVKHDTKRVAEQATEQEKPYHPWEHPNIEALKSMAKDLAKAGRTGLELGHMAASGAIAYPLSVAAGLGALLGGATKEEARKAMEEQAGKVQQFFA